MITAKPIEQTLVPTKQVEASILVIGSGSVMDELQETVSSHKTLASNIIYLKWNLYPNAEHEVRRLKTLVSQYNIKKVVIAMHNRRGNLPIKQLLNLRVSGIEIVDAGTFYEEISGKICVASLKPSALIFCKGFNRLGLHLLFKRMIDLLLAVLGLIVASPFFFILPIFIKLNSKGPVFYRQERIGEKEVPFTIFKFRSMYNNAEEKTGPVWADKNDPRVTKIGRIMRKLRLDELPQLFNVLKGEMSLVGPRPERHVFIKDLKKKIPFYGLRLAVKPGLTGWAQIKYRYGSSSEDALEKHQYDLYYIKHLSPFFDLSIIFQTMGVVLMGKGAR